MNVPHHNWNWHRAHTAKLTAGERAADKLRNGMGSWTFVFCFLLFMGGWAVLNTVAVTHHWDKYPFILLNLFLSMLAGLQGAILLIAAKRADSVSAAMAENDYQTNVRAEKEINELTELNRRELELLEEILKELRALKR